MPQPPKTKLQKQTDVWYKKLKDKGFDDIEYPNGSIRSCLPQGGHKDPELQGIIQEYYYMATHFLNDHKFLNELDQVIWTYHTEGISPRNIEKLLKKVKVGKLKRTAIYDTIERLEIIMKQKYLSA